jgi:peptide/nickel transport system permease protein
VTRLVVRRLVSLVAVVWLVATITFFIVCAAPGTYADQLEDARQTPEARQALRAKYGLDDPVYTQYLRWLEMLIRGDLGTSYLYKIPVISVLGQALPNTIILAGTALLLDLLLGIMLAVAATRRPHGAFDRLTTVLSLGLYGLPSFWLAGVLVLVFALHLGWFPASHMHSIGATELGRLARLADLAYHLVLPALCLGVVGAASTARYLRASLLDLQDARYLLAARARGLSERRVLWVHTLRPALVPVVTIVGLSLPVLVSGSVVIEVVFSWPGMGQVLWNAANARDVPVIMATTVVGAVGVALSNLIADVLYAVVDPRVREGS